MAKASTKNSNTQVAKHLSWVLSDTYLLLIKTHGFHWNVTGELFPQLHTLFEGQYNELFAAVDEIAERIRALGTFAPGSAAAFHSQTEVRETTTLPNAKGMVKDLLVANENLRARVAEAGDLAGEVGDKASEDLMNARLRAHDKAIWMLRSIVE